MLKMGLIISIFAVCAYADVKESAIRNLTNKIIEEKIPNCLDVTTHYDKVYCAGKIYNVLDDELNGVYKSLVRKLSKDQKSKLQKVQKTWINKRDDSCATVSSKGIIINMTCSIKATVESLYYLREIKSNLKDFSLLLKEYKNNK